MDCVVNGVAKSQTRLSNFHFKIIILLNFHSILRFLKLCIRFEACLEKSQVLESFHEHSLRVDINEKYFSALGFPFQGLRTWKLQSPLCPQALRGSLAR